MTFFIFKGKITIEKSNFWGWVLLELANLTAPEKKILKAALKCGEQKLTLKGLAEESGVKPAVLCEKLKSPEFRALFIETMKSSITAETPAILHIFTQAAKEGSFQHGKLILEMTGVHSDKQKIELGGKVEFTESPFKSDEERQAFLQATANKFKGDE